jgi:hypothetical protein
MVAGILVSGLARLRIRRGFGPLFRFCFEASAPSFENQIDFQTDGSQVR